MPTEPPAAYTIIEFDPDGHWEYELPEAEGGQPTSLSPAELDQLDTALTAGIIRLNTYCEQEYAPYWAANPTSSFNRAFKLIDLPRYVRQYLLFRTPSGQRLVWVKLLLFPHDTWRTELNWVLDGGNSYVNGLYEPEAGKFHWLQPNGQA